MVTNEAQGIFTRGMQVGMLFLGNIQDNNTRGPEGPEALTWSP